MPEQTKPTVYIETTVVSYLSSLPSRDIVVAAHQQITREWWSKALPLFDSFVSPVVVDEVGRGNQQYANARLAAVKEFASLAVTQEVVDLADDYVTALQIPDPGESRVRCTSSCACGVPRNGLFGDLELCASGERPSKAHFDQNQFQIRNLYAYNMYAGRINGALT